MSTDRRTEARALVLKIAADAEALTHSEARDALIAECRALAEAIRTFHLEGIRFRMYNVDRHLSRGTVALAPETHAAFAEARRALEESGFHTRSHQAPT